MWQFLMNAIGSQLSNKSFQITDGYKQDLTQQSEHKKIALNEIEECLKQIHASRFH